MPSKAYLVSIGSNIEPTKNVPLAIEMLLSQATRCVLSRAIQTEPVGMISPHPFVNLIAYLEIPLAPLPLKAFFNDIEASLGRDRSDPQRKVKDRPIDLDILVAINSYEDNLKAILDAPDYCRSILFELLTNLTHDLSDLESITVPLQIGEIGCGHRPISLPAPLSWTPSLVAPTPSTVM